MMIVLSQTETNALLIGACTASSGAFFWWCIFFANAHPVRNICKAALFHVSVAVEHQIEIVPFVRYHFEWCILNPGAQWII